MPRRAWTPPAGVLPAPPGPLQPDWRYEQAAHLAGHRAVAGCDEVGRGAWAGPLLAAAVVFPPALIAATEGVSNLAYQDTLAALAAVRDSKELPPAARDALDAVIRRHAQVALGQVSAALCDRIGMAAANRLALTRAIRALPSRPDFVLLDAFPLPLLPIPQLALIKGDARVVSIAAASIVAKVARDALMDGYHACWPAYRFDNNKGYGTAAHSAALALAGPCPQHRRCFAPVRAP